MSKVRYFLLTKRKVNCSSFPPLKGSVRSEWETPVSLDVLSRSHRLRVDEYLVRSLRKQVRQFARVNRVCCVLRQKRQTGTHTLDPCPVVCYQTRVALKTIQYTNYRIIVMHIYMNIYKRNPERLPSEFSPPE